MYSAWRARSLTHLLVLSFVALVAMALPLNPVWATAKDGPAPTLESADSIRAWIKVRRFAEADSSARWLVSSTERSHGSQSIETARALDLLVEVRRKAGKGATPGTPELAERTVQIRERLLPAEHLDLAESRVSLAEVLIQAGKHAAARTHLERALEVRLRAQGPDHLSVATTASLLGTVLKNLGDLEGARSMKERSLSIRQRQLPPEDPVIAGNLNDLANVLTELGEYEQAESLYTRAIRTRDRDDGADDPRLAEWLGNLGRLQQRLGNYAAGRQSLERSLAIQVRSFGPEDRRLGFTLTQLGVLLEGIGESEAARDTLERALHIRENALGMSHVLVATTLDKLADVYARMGDPARARSLLERALQIRSNEVGPTHPNVASTLFGLVEVLADLRDEAGAESAAVRSVSIWEDAYGPNHRFVAAGLKKFAELRSRQGRFGEAIGLLERARRIETDVLGSSHADIAATDADLAESYWKAGDSLLAFASALSSERVAREHLRSLGKQLSEREALEYGSVRTTGLDVALTIAERELPDSLNRMLFDAVIRSRAIVLDGGLARRRTTAESADTTIGRLTAELEVATRRLSRLLVRGPDDESPGAYKLELERSRLEKERAERALAQRNSTFSRESESYRAGLHEVESLLPPHGALLAFTRYDRVSFETRRHGPGDLNRTAGARYSVFVLADSPRTLTLIPLGDANRIDRLIARWRKEAGTGPLRSGSSRKAEVAYRARAEELRRAIWDPVVPVTRGADRVFVVPDGAVSLVSFAALPAGRGTYILDRGPVVHYLTAERDLAAPRGRATRGPLMAMGNPNFNERGLFASLSPSGSTRSEDRRASSMAHAAATEAYRSVPSRCGAFRAIRFDPLPATALEIEDILRFWQSDSAAHTGQGAMTSVVLTGARATEAAFKVRAPGAGVLHLATHGFFLGGDCPTWGHAARGIGEMATAPKPAGRMTAPRKEPSTTAKPQPKDGALESPLLLSGLALAGANHRDAARGAEEDGIVTAEEIAAMNLTGVRCAVLSACDTGVGELTVGEGVLGLRRAFQVAGTSTVVMSLWSVEDTAARKWMATFYDSLLSRGSDIADAAREASRAVLAERRSRGRSGHPFYWAAFVVGGDWR